MAGRRIVVQELTEEAFGPFGTFANLLNPPDEARLKEAEPPVEFFPDLVGVNLNGYSAFMSTCRVHSRPMVVDVTEFHRETGEGILPLDGDVVIHVGPRTEEDAPPLDKIRAFRVPQGTQVALHAEVWHHAPFSLTDQPVAVQITLPFETYRNNCIDVTLEEGDQIEVVLA